MARHRESGGRFRLRVAAWPLAVVAVLLISTLGYLGWTSLGNMVERRADAEAASCSRGDRLLRVAAPDSLTEPLIEAAQRWSADRPVVQDHCVRVEVVSTSSAEVLDGLLTGWNEAEAGPRPHAWVADSMYWVQRLSAEDPGLIGSPPQVLASSPVLLAMTAPAAEAVRLGGGLRWSDLPELVADPAGWTRYGQAEWGDFRLVLPDPAVNSATGLALQGALTGADGTGPVTVEALAEEPARDVLRALWDNEPLEVPPTTRDALLELASASDPAGQELHAAPVVEVDLYRRNLGLDGIDAPDTPVEGFLPGGASPRAEFPLIAINGGEDDSLSSRAAQLFAEFLDHRDQQRLLAEAGFRVTAVMHRPNPAPGVPWSAPDALLEPADGPASQALVEQWHGLAER